MRRTSTPLTKAIKRVPVESSNINSIGFDRKKKTLEVEFKNGAIYRYNPISSLAKTQLMEAKSIGAHFSLYIKDNPLIHCQKIKDGKKPKSGKIPKPGKQMPRVR